MRICILKESLILGGTERSAANISKALSKRNDVYMAVFDGSKTAYSYGGTLIDLKSPPCSGFFQKIANNFNRYTRYKEFIEREKIEILYEFTSITNPLIYIKHPSCLRIISSRDYGAFLKYGNRYHRALINADAIICNSEYLRSAYIAKYPDQKDKIFAVYNMIDRYEIQHQACESVETEFSNFTDAHKHSIVSVGRFCAVKGYEYLIQAFALAREEDPDLGLVLIGDGNLRNQYQTMVEEYGLQDHIFMTGFNENPYKYMAKCQCFVLSSLSEGFPNVLAEAMVLKLPVISTNCYTGPAEILRDDKNYQAVSDKYELCDYGILTPSLSQGRNAIKELANAIGYLFKNPLMMRKYSNLSYERALLFSEEACVSQLEEIFSKLNQKC